MDFILVQVNHDEIIRGQFQIIITTFDANDIRARSFDSLQKSCWEERYKHPGPSKRIQKLNDRLAHKVKHGCMGRQEDDS